MVHNETIRFYVGTYSNGSSQGIYQYSITPDGRLDSIGLAALCENPSFLTKSPDNRFLLAVNEITNAEQTGTVESWRITKDSLQFISRQSSGGAHPCHVTVNDSGYVLTSNYTGGNVGLLKLNPTSGKLSTLLAVQQHTGQGSTQRQQGPHAHSSWFIPGSNQVISVDLGTNELWFSEVVPDQSNLVPIYPVRLAMAEGAGPRHLTFHPNKEWIYVVNELNCTVSLIKKDKDSDYQVFSSISTLPADYNQENTCADIHVSKDGKFLYASNRGHNSIAIFSVDDKDGTLTTVGHASTHGDSPRNFSLSPDDQLILVANQKTNNIVAFKRDAVSGLLTYVDEIGAPTPVCILF